MSVTQADEHERQSWRAVMNLLKAGCLCVMALVIAPRAEAQSSNTVAGAPRVQSRIRLQTIDTTEGGAPKTLVQVAVDKREQGFRNLAADELFSAHGPIEVTVRHFNPLAAAVTVTVDDVADPSAAILEKLAEGLSEMFGGLAGEPIAKLSAEASVKGCVLPDDLVAQVQAEPWRGDKIKETLDGLSTLIDRGFGERKTGPAAVSAAVRELDEFLRGRKESLGKIDTGLKTACPGAVVIELLRVRRDHFAQIIETLEGIRAALASAALITKWAEGDRSDFIVKHSLEPTRSTMRKVSVTFSRLSYTTLGTTGSVATRKQEVAKGSFLVRRYARLIPEIGVGLAYSKVTRPRFGTAVNDAGQTVIAEAAPEEGSLDPTVLVNFVCGFCQDWIVVPMAQLGVSASKSSPALFFGGGIRLFDLGKGNFALSGGRVLPFARKLKDGAAVGKVIESAAALDAELGWRPAKWGWYGVLQYKF